MNGWVNNREAGDLRRYLAHYDVIVMYTLNDLYLNLRLNASLWDLKVWLAHIISIIGPVAVCHKFAPAKLQGFFLWRMNML